MNDKLISASAVGGQVFLAVDGFDGITHLPVGERVELERLSVDDDGIWPTPAHFNRFISANFVRDGYFVETVSPSVLKRFCYPPEKFVHLFAQRVGADVYLPVSADDVELTYGYEPLYSRRSEKVSTIEIFVTAKFRGAAL